MVKIYYGPEGTPPGPRRGVQLCFFNEDVDVTYDASDPSVQEAADAQEDALEY